MTMIVDCSDRISPFLPTVFNNLSAAKEVKAELEADCADSSANDLGAVISARYWGSSQGHKALKYRGFGGMALFK